MTVIGSFIYKTKARKALSGNWQTALLVTFFCGVLVTIAQVVQSVSLSDVQNVLNSLTFALNNLAGKEQLTATQRTEVLDLYARLFAAVDGISRGTWILLLVLNGLALALTPALAVSCNRYFIRLVRGEETGVTEGITACLSIWGRALWLYVVMLVRILLWSLLLVIPGIIAALRYSMAPYYLAEDPTLSAGEAIAKSKETMADKKTAYFSLRISFIWWSLALNAAQMLMISLFGNVIALVGAQFFSLMLSAYVNASCATFYIAGSSRDGLDQLMSSVHKYLRESIGENVEIPFDEAETGQTENDDSDDGSPEDDA